MVRQEVFGVVVLDNPVRYLDWKEHKIFHNCGGRVDLSKEGKVSRFECGECRFSLSVSDAIGDMVRRMIAYVARTGEVVARDLIDIDNDNFELQVAPIAPKGDELGEAFREFLKTYRSF